MTDAFGAALLLFVLNGAVSIDHRTSGTLPAITLSAGDWCSGSGQGPIDCPREYYKKHKRKSK